MAYPLTSRPLERSAPCRTISPFAPAPPSRPVIARRLSAFRPGRRADPSHVHGHRSQPGPTTNRRRTNKRRRRSISRACPRVAGRTTNALLFGRVLPSTRAHTTLSFVYGAQSRRYHRWNVFIFGRFRAVVSPKRPRFLDTARVDDFLHFSLTRIGPAQLVPSIFLSSAVSFRHFRSSVIIIKFPKSNGQRPL